MTLIYKKGGHVATITFNRPETRNALDPETIDEFYQAIVNFGNDSELWAAIITGTGEKAFSSGADLKKLVPALRDRTYRIPPSIMRGLHIWKPFIAAVNGAALGGGLEIALACDLRIAAEHATFGNPEVKWGLIPGWGGTQRLRMMLPMAKTSEMLLMGEIIDAAEALRIGLVNKVVPFDELMPTAMNWAQRICENGPLAVRAAKEALIRGMDMSLECALRLEEMLSDWLYTTEDAKEGLSAFTEKRKPHYLGK